MMEVLIVVDDLSDMLDEDGDMKEVAFLGRQVSSLLSTRVKSLTARGTKGLKENVFRQNFKRCLLLHVSRVSVPCLLCCKNLVVRQKE